MLCFETSDLQLTATLLALFRTEIGSEPVTAGSQVRILSALVIVPFGGPSRVVRMEWCLRQMPSLRQARN